MAESEHRMNYSSDREHNCQGVQPRFSHEQRETTCNMYVVNGSGRHRVSKTMKKTGFMIISIILLVQPAGYLSLGFIGFIYKSA